MNRKLLLTVLTCIPAFIHAEAYDFSQFGNKKNTASFSQLSPLISKLYFEAYGGLSPERCLLEFISQQETTKEAEPKKKSKRKDREQNRSRHSQEIKKSSIKNTEKSAKEMMWLNERIRTQKGFAGVTLGYSLNRQHVVELSGTGMALSPFTMMPAISYKWITIPTAEQFTKYVSIGLVAPLAYDGRNANTSHKEAVKQQEEPMSGIEGDTHSVKSARSSHSKTSSSRSRGAISTKQSALNNKQTATAPSRPSKETPTKNSSPPKSPPPLQWNTGILLTGGMTYPLYPKIFFKCSLNVLYPLSKSPPSSQLPLGCIAWIQVNVHIKII